MRIGSLAAVLLLAACGGDARDASAPATTATTDRVVVELGPEHDSGVSGEATLEENAAGGVAVLFDLTVPAELAGEALPAHIHDVTCDEYREIEDFDTQLGTVSDHLASVQDGQATSTAATPLEELAAGGYSINVHRPAHPYETVACGDIPGG